MKKPDTERKSVILLPVICLILAGAAACNGGEDDPGPVILRVDGMEIGLKEFEREYYFRSAFTPIVEEGKKEAPNEFTADELRSRVLNGSIIPFAAVRQAYKDKIPEIMERAEEIHGRISEDKSNFSDLSAEHSTPSTASSKGRLGYFGRGAMLPYPLPQKAFSMKIGEVSEPFLSTVGCHILYITDIVEGVDRTQDRVEAYHILLAYEGRPDFIQTTLADLTAKARIEVVDAGFESLVERRNP